MPRAVIAVVIVVMLAACASARPGRGVSFARIDAVLLDLSPPAAPASAEPGKLSYVGRKRYDRVVLQLTSDAPAALASVDRVELFTGDATTPAATIYRRDARAFRYRARQLGAARGAAARTQEQLEIAIGGAVRAYMRDTHPFTVVVRARTSDGTLVYETALTGDQVGA